MKARRSWLRPVLLAVVLAFGCTPRGGSPGEFPPAHLGSPRAEVQSAVSRAPGRVVEASTRMMRVAARDRRVEEEVFLFYDGRLAAWTQRLAQPVTRKAFLRTRDRYTRYFGKPIESRDDGLVLTARWRDASQQGRVLLSAYVGDRTGQARLMVRVEDPSVLRSLIRQMGREESSGGTGDSARH